MEIFIVIGVLLYVVIAIDILQTTLSMQGGGWITSRASHLFWKVLLSISGRNGRSWLLGHTGYLLLTSIVFSWVISLWASLTFILYGIPGAIVESTTKIPADFGELVYYSGYSLSTLGMGDYVATTNIAKLITSFYSFTGLILLTMSVTYFVPVLDAVIVQRQLGVKLRSLGESPQTIIINGWNGKNFDRLINKIEGISDLIIKYSQQHRAYPVVHYFHNTDPDTAVILQLARLYEALQILSCQVSEDIKPAAEDLKPLKVAYKNYFKVIKQVTHFSFDSKEPAWANIAWLQESQLVPEDLKKLELADMEKDQRVFFNSLILLDGWSWENVDPKSS